MKRLDLSCLPINLEVGEAMELIDEEGKYHLLKCVEPEINYSCKGCFFANKKMPFNCDQIRCSEQERDQEVRYVELPGKDELREEENNMKKLDFDTIEETGKIKAGEIFIFVDSLGVQHKVIAKKVGTSGDWEACRSCVFNSGACRFVNCSKSDRESKDDVYFVKHTKTQ